MEIVGPEDEPGLAYKWASNQNYVSDCLTSNESAPELGELVGTGYVARDIIQLLNAIEGKDAALNFYGLSYGTILGTTFAALFPERVGHMVLDGNVNVPEWYDGVELSWFKDADSALLDLFERCIDAGPELCPLAARNETATKLNDRFYKVLDDLYTAPIPLGSTFVLDPSNLKAGLRISLYGPDSYLPLTKVFDELFKPVGKRNMTALAEAWLPIGASADFVDVLPDDSPSGIFCGDKTIRTQDFSDVYPDLAEQFANVSRSIGDLANNLDYTCLLWPWHAKGAYNGSWHEEIETKNPILFIGNTYDPVSPIDNARNSSAIFKGSAVLEHEGVGHASFSHSSLCTAKAVRAYFHDGELPKENTKCKTDFGVFDVGKSWKDSLLPDMGWE
jgi:pimeloyl-ACP methyl ester carboxylesterase